MIAIEFRGWESITDVSCPTRNCPGELRWAEAGYVPGYRICDCCGSHFALREDGLRLVRRLRSSPRKIQRMQQLRRAQEAQNTRFHLDWRRQQTDRANADWPITRACPHGVHGKTTVEIPPDDIDSAAAVNIDAIEPAEHQTLIYTCWELNTLLDRVAHEARIISATRDGSAVMVYQVSWTYLPWDGWWRTADLRRAIGLRRPDPSGKLDATERQALGVWR